MENNINFINVDIETHNNWKIIEDYMKTKLISNTKLTFISFCEMYFYKKKGEVLKNDWVGIVHDPEDTHNFFDNRNLLTDSKFQESLPFCKGLFCMSPNLKKWLIETLNPDFFVEVLYHPLSSKNLKEFSIETYLKDKRIIQIGNWLRKTYAIFKIKTDVKKLILPFNQRTLDELVYFIRKDKIEISKTEIDSVYKVVPISDDEYDGLFKNHVLFLNLYSSTANNVILECIKSNNPIIINRHEAIEAYLGKDYPLFYDNLSEVSDFLDDDVLIFKAYLYLRNMNKDKFSVDNMVNKINLTLMQQI